ncbi:hypothetical protein EBU99_10720 [bacterium]|nr:hypothetical protein [bacterium]
MLKSVCRRIQVSSIVVLAAAFGTGSAARADSSQDFVSTKQETELRIGLTEKGFETVRRWIQQNATQTGRQDFYFDAHDGGHFVLRRSGPRAKARIQLRADQLVQQKSWLDVQSTLSSDGFNWISSVRTSGIQKSSTDGSVSQDVAKSVVLLRSAAKRKQFRATEIAQLKEIWTTVAWPKLSTFDSAAAGLQVDFVPAAFVNKERWVFGVQGESGEVYKVQLGRDTDALQLTGETGYEIETELKDDSSPEAQQRAIVNLSHWLKERGVAPEDTIPGTSIDFFRGLESMYAAPVDN